MNVTTVLTVHGTKASARAGGLDDDEVNEFAISPGEYDRSLTSVSELVSQISRSAYMRGEWISSLRIDDVDVVERIASEELRESHGDIEAAVHSMLEMGMFSHAEPSELRQLLRRASNSQDSDDGLQ